MTAAVALFRIPKQGLSPMKLRIACVSGFVLAASAMYGQATPRTMSAAEHVAIGDRDHAAMNAPIALRHYEAALTVDSMYYDALIKAAHEAVDVGLHAANEADRTALYKRAEQYARRAVLVKPNDAESHFELARAIGRNAQTMGKKDQVKYAGIVHDEALAALKIDPAHAGALHIMGEWNAAIMRLNGFTRFMAKNVLGGKTFGEASWDNAQRYMERAVALDSGRITHHLDLARIYKDRDMKEKAREQLEWIAKAPLSEYNDKFFKQEAAAALADLK
jgi:tetratricopeptide (TPR) repeat protein